jgi:hypothetical protein
MSASSGHIRPIFGEYYVYPRMWDWLTPAFRVYGIRPIYVTDMCRLKHEDDWTVGAGP